MPELTPEERDARTVVCMQLASRIRPEDLKEFFSSVGKVCRSIWSIYVHNSIGRIITDTSYLLLCQSSESDLRLLRFSQDVMFGKATLLETSWALVFLIKLIFAFILWNIYGYGQRMSLLKLSVIPLYFSHFLKCENISMFCVLCFISH